MQSYNQLSPVPPLTRVTKALIITCVSVYLIDFVLIHLGIFNLSEIFGLVPLYVIERLWVWQTVTYIFLHGNLLHILLNMLILWYFGAEIEMRLGESAFLKYFLFCGIGAGLFNLGVNVMFNDVSRLSHPIIGASGSIFGLLAAYGIFFGNRYFLVFFLFPMKAKYFVLLMAAIELIMGVEARSEDNVAHFAHLGGMLVGGIWIYLRYVRGFNLLKSAKQSRKNAERDRLRKKFTLIVNQGEEGEDDDDYQPPPEDPGGKYWN